MFIFGVSFFLRIHNLSLWPFYESSLFLDHNSPSYTLPSGDFTVLKLWLRGHTLSCLPGHCVCVASSLSVNVTLFQGCCFSDLNVPLNSIGHVLTGDLKKLIQGAVYIMNMVYCEILCFSAMVTCKDISIIFSSSHLLLMAAQH